jgi:hypothetical protein
MTTGKLYYALVTTLLATMIGCGGEFQDVQDANESQTSQDVTGCELDCPDGFDAHLPAAAVQRDREQHEL